MNKILNKQWRKIYMMMQACDVFDNADQLRYQLMILSTCE